MHRGILTKWLAHRIGFWGKFCRSKSCAIFMVSTITRSELMRQNARRTLTLWVVRHRLVVDPLDFNVYAITNPPTEIVPHGFVKQTHKHTGLSRWPQGQQPL
jgi:hypothetical protein